jgi:hypothetical protein
MLIAAYGGIAFSTHAVESCATIAGVTVAGVIASAARQRKERELVDVRAVADVDQCVLLHQVPARARAWQRSRRRRRSRPRSASRSMTSRISPQSRPTSNGALSARHRAAAS